jgi:hypothetical protein
MILDALTTFCNALSVAASAGTAPVGDTLDTSPLNTPWSALSGVTSVGSNAGRDFGAGDTLWIYLLVTTGFVGATATVDIQLMESNTLSSNNLSSASLVIDLTGGATAVASLPAKTAFRLALPRGIRKQYLQLQVITATATTTSGSISAYLTPVVQDATLVAEGFLIK